MVKEILELRKPLLVNGVERKELAYDIEELTINRLARAEAHKIKLGGAELAAKVGFAQTDYPLQICIGMQAIIALNPEISEEDMERIKGHDITKLASIGQRFFIGQEESEQNTSEKPQEPIQNTTVAQ